MKKSLQLLVSLPMFVGCGELNDNSKDERSRALTIESIGVDSEKASGDMTLGGDSSAKPAKGALIIFCLSPVDSEEFKGFCTETETALGALYDKTYMFTVTKSKCANFKNNYGDMINDLVAATKSMAPSDPKVPFNLILSSHGWQDTGVSDDLHGTLCGDARDMASATDNKPNLLVPTGELLDAIGSKYPGRKPSVIVESCYSGAYIEDVTKQDNSGQFYLAQSIPATMTTSQAGEVLYYTNLREGILDAYAKCVKIDAERDGTITFNEAMTAFRDTRFTLPPRMPKPEFTVFGDGSQPLFNSCPIVSSIKVSKVTSAAESTRTFKSGDTINISLGSPTKNCSFKWDGSTFKQSGGTECAATATPMTASKISLSVAASLLNDPYTKWTCRSLVVGKPSTDLPVTYGPTRSVTPDQPSLECDVEVVARKDDRPWVNYTVSITTTAGKPTATVAENDAKAKTVTTTKEISGKVRTGDTLNLQAMTDSSVGGANKLLFDKWSWSWGSSERSSDDSEKFSLVVDPPKGKTELSVTGEFNAKPGELTAKFKWVDALTGKETSPIIDPSTGTPPTIIVSFKSYSESFRSYYLGTTHPIATNESVVVKRVEGPDATQQVGSGIESTFDVSVEEGPCKDIGDGSSTSAGCSFMPTSRKVKFLFVIKYKLRIKPPATADFKVKTIGGTPSDGPLTVAGGTPLDFSWMCPAISTATLTKPEGVTTVPPNDHLVVTTPYSAGTNDYTLTCSYAVPNSPNKPYTLFTKKITINTKQPFVYASWGLNVSKKGNGLVTSIPAGINCGDTCTKSFSYETTKVSLIASGTTGADTATKFVSWSGSCNGTLPACEVQPSGQMVNSSVQATFSNNFRLSVVKAGEGFGSITSAPAGINCGVDCKTEQKAYFEEAKDVVLTAAAPNDHKFIKWTNGCSGTQPTCTVKMSAAKSVTAEFQPTYKIRIDVVGSGTVKDNALGIDCGSACEKSFPKNTSVILNLTATPADGYELDSISGGGCKLGSPCYLTVTNPTETITVKFSKKYKLTVKKAGSGDGTISVSKANGEAYTPKCKNPDCSEMVFDDVSGKVKFWPQANVGSKIISVTGVEGYTSGYATLTIDGDRTVTVTFGRTKELKLTVEGSILSSVSIYEPTGSPAICTDRCTRTYDQGTVLNIVAKPATGYRVASWGEFGCEAGTLNCSVTLDVDKSGTVKFAKSVKLNLTIQGNGTVTVDGAAVNPNGYPVNTAVKLAARGLAPNMTVRWTGPNGSACSSADCNLAMSEDKTLTAVFEQAAVQNVKLSVINTGQGAGKVVSAGSSAIDCGELCQGSFAKSLGSVILEARPSAGTSFAGWSGPGAAKCTGMSLTCSVDISQPSDISITAKFEAMYQVKVSLTPSSAAGVITFSPQGSPCSSANQVVPNCATFALGTYVTMSAYPNPNWRFIGWNGNSQSAATFSANIDGEKTFSAAFSQALMLTTKKTGQGSLTISADKASMGNCGSDCKLYPSGTIARIIASPATNALFVTWGSADCPVQSQYSASPVICTLTMSSNKMINATFSDSASPTQTPAPTPTVTPTGSGTGTSTDEFLGTRCANSSEDSPAILECGGGKKIVIQDASYGLPALQGESICFEVNNSCHAADSKKKVQVLCDNKTTCSVSADNGTFGDPCPNTVKKIAIAYRCL